MVAKVRATLPTNPSEQPHRWLARNVLIFSALWRVSERRSLGMGGKKMQTQLEVRTEETATVEQWLAEARLEGREDTYAGKRRYPRVTWHVPVILDGLDGERAGECYYATTKDLSAGGMGFRCRQPVPVRSLVRVMSEIDGQSVYAKVMHCTETVGACFIGVEFQPQEQIDRATRECA